MNSSNLPLIKKLFLVAVITLITSACGKIAGGQNYTLGEGSTISGPLFLFSNNALLEKDTTVDGPVVMICCNLTVGGDVNSMLF